MQFFQNLLESVFLGHEISLSERILPKSRLIAKSICSAAFSLATAVLNDYPQKASTRPLKVKGTP
jgi:hypothetical protein